MKNLVSNFFSFMRYFFSQRTVIFFTDCRDSNARSRVYAHLTARTSNVLVECFGIETWQEAALNIVNVLEVWEKSHSSGNIVVGNIAPRDDKHWQNGAPFCFTWIKGNLVVATPTCFAVLMKQGRINPAEIYQTDVRTVCEKFLKKTEVEEIAKTQFRSLWYVPRLIQWILNGKRIPFTVLDITNIPEVQQEVMFVDNFGNVKFSIQTEEFTPYDQSVLVRISEKSYSIPVYPRLSNIPSGEYGFIVGSAGFIELVLNGGNASAYFGLKVGDKIEFV